MTRAESNLIGAALLWVFLAGMLAGAAMAFRDSPGVVILHDEDLGEMGLVDTKKFGARVQGRALPE